MMQTALKRPPRALRSVCLHLLAFVLSCFCFAEEQKTFVKNPDSKSQSRVKLEAFVDRAVAETSETVRLTIRLTAPDEMTEVTIPEIGDRILGLRISEFGQTDPVSLMKGYRQSTRWYNLMADVSGSYMIPSVSLSYSEGGSTQELSTADIFVEFKAPESEEATKSEEGKESMALTPDIRDIKGLITTPPDYKSWIFLMLSLVALLAMGYGVWFYQRRLRNRKEPLVPPYDVALAELDHLKSSGLLESGQTKEFHYRLSESIRRYVEFQFEFSALDRTIEEITASLSQVPQLSEGSRDLFLSLLKSSDRVKFTDDHCGVDESVRMLNQSRDFVLTTKPQESLEEDSVI